MGWRLRPHLMRAGPCASSRPMASADAHRPRESACIVYVSPVPVLARALSRFKSSCDFPPEYSEINFHRSWVTWLLKTS